MSGKQTTYQSIRLTKDTTRSDDREIELTISQQGVNLEKECNYWYDYECWSLNKEQALQLADQILKFYEIQEEK